MMAEIAGSELDYFLLKADFKEIWAFSAVFRGQAPLYNSGEMLI